MLQILTLRFVNGPGVGWTERVSRHVSLALDFTCDWIDESALPVRKLDQDGLLMIGNKGGILPIDDYGCLVLALFLVMTMRILR